MQDKELPTPKEKRNWLKLLWLCKLVVTVLIVSYIYRTFQNEQKGILDIKEVFSRIIVIKHFPILSLMLLLVPLNWALESIKWQQLAKKVVPISFWDAFRGTLTGLAVGVAAPAQLGDTIGRVAALPSDNRLQAIGAAVVSNGIQFYVSVIAGAIGWFYLKDSIPLNQPAKTTISAGLILLVALGWIVVFFRKQLLTWNPERSFLKKLYSYFKIIGAYTAKDLALSTSYGLLRYLVFLTQFVLALSLFGFQLSIPTLSASVTLIFLAKTIIPAINVLGDLGLREFTALFVFKQYNLPAEEIITATFLVWIINVMGPILIGIFLIWKYKWKPKND